jgi:transposase-like protein
MNKPETSSLYEFFSQIPDEEAARLYFEAKRWGGTPVCAHCGSTNAAECKDHRPMPYRCRDCRKHFSVRMGTVLGESKLDLHKWLMAIYLMTTTREGMTSAQLARELGVSRKAANTLATRIRESWLDDTRSFAGKK